MKTSLNWLVCLLATLLVHGAFAADERLGADAARALPIADAHFHVMPWMDLGELVRYMDKHGIRWAGGAAALGGPARNVEAVAAIGARYIRQTGQGQWLALKREAGVAALEVGDSPAFQRLLESVERDLRDNGARVIGEIHVNTLQTAANPTVLHKIKADAPTLKALLNLAGKYARPLNLHAQWDRDTAREFAQLAASSPTSRLILSHCGSTAEASEIRELLKSHPNVVCDLSFRSPPQLKGRALGRAVFDSQLRSDWKALIEDFPDRFAVGVDDVHSWDEYEATVINIRFGLLANLSPASAEKVANRNARAWFGID